MNIAEQALANAIPLEAKKDGLRQRQSGDWVLNLVIAAPDMDQRIAVAAMGTRYQCALVEITDDETPRNHVAEARDKWRALSPTQQTGIRCNDPVFWAWLEEAKKFKNVNNHDRAAEIVRDHCKVTSRRDLSKPGFQEARIRWHDFDYEFQGWKARENG